MAKPIRQRKATKNQVVVYGVAGTLIKLSPISLKLTDSLKDLGITRMLYDNFVVELAQRTKHGSFLNRSMTLGEVVHALDDYDRHIASLGKYYVTDRGTNHNEGDCEV